LDIKINLDLYNTNSTPHEMKMKILEELNELYDEIALGIDVDEYKVMSELLDVNQAVVHWMYQSRLKNHDPIKSAYLVSIDLQSSNYKHNKKMKEYAEERGWTR
jgi:hypothetical protein